MTRTFAVINSLLKWLTILCAMVLILCVSGYLLGLRINTTPSIAVGLYRTTDLPVTTGEYVIFCPPAESIFLVAKARGYVGPGTCDGGMSYMMKKVVAVAADHVVVSAEGVRVNGRLLPYSAPLTQDGMGRPMITPTMDITLAENEVWVMTDSNSLSFDSRYFGPITRDRINSVIVPVWTRPDWSN